MRPAHFSNRHRPTRKPRNGGGSWGRSANGKPQASKANLHRILEKYLASARNASRSGDKIAAEGFYQHAEHYQRLINESQTENVRGENLGKRAPSEPPENT